MITCEFEAKFFDEDDNEFSINFNLISGEDPSHDNPLGADEEIFISKVVKVETGEDFVDTDFDSETQVEMLDACWDRLRWGF